MAIDESGRLLEKYHKTHLYDTAPHTGESHWFDYPVPNPRSFRTSFGVTFGMFICFDILFRQPAADLAMAHNISDWVFSTHWESPGPPMLPAPSVQQGFSAGLGVNVLGSNAARTGPLSQSQGSGIYAAGEALAMQFDPTKENDEFMLVRKLVSHGAPHPNLVQGKAPLAAEAAQDAPAVMPAALTAKAEKAAAPPGAAYGPSDGTDMAASTIVPFDALNTSQAKLTATTSSGFRCDLSFAVSSSGVDARPTGNSTFSLLALDGAWFRGVLRSRTCAILLCPGGLCTQDPLTPTAADFASDVAFDWLELTGTFQPVRKPHNLPAWRSEVVSCSCRVTSSSRWYRRTWASSCAPRRTGRCGAARCAWRCGGRRCCTRCCLRTRARPPRLSGTGRSWRVCATEGLPSTRSTVHQSLTSSLSTTVLVLTSMFDQ